MDSFKKVLLNPGPVTLTDRVRNSLMQEDLCHREKKFADLLINIKKQLLDVYNLSEDYDAVVLAGSGTCAVEAMLKSFVNEQDRVLVLSNGVYGERMFSMLEKDKKKVKNQKGNWLRDTDLDLLDVELNSGNFTKVVCVHNETTTGRLNDINSVLDICEKHSVKLLLDAVSSFGGEEINFQSPALFSVAATANKCLHGITGAAFVISKNGVFEESVGNSSSMYLDLNNYWLSQKDGWCPFTPSIHSLYSLQEALNELEDLGGVRQRNKRYKETAKIIREQLALHGVDLLIEEDSYSSMISSFYIPEKQSYQEIYDSFLEQGFIIYSGQGELANKIFRICNMGDINDSDISLLSSVIRKSFN